MRIRVWAYTGNDNESFLWGEYTSPIEADRELRKAIRDYPQVTVDYAPNGEFVTP